MAVIADHPERHRYELELDGHKAAEVVYRIEGGTIELIHTEVKPQYEGRGLASQIVTFALDDARRRGLKVVASCTYVQRFIAKHAGYGDLLAQR